MGAPVTLLLVVSLSGDEVRLGQLRATLEAQLDPRQVQLRVRRADGVPSLDETLEAAAQRGPVAVVTNPRKGRFELRVALEPGRWAARTFTFAARDPVRERNRTVALAIASMTPEWRLAEPLPEQEPPAEAETPTVPALSASDVQAAPPEPPAPAEEPEADPDPLHEAISGLAPPIVSEPPASSTGFRLELGAVGETWPLGGGGAIAGQYCAGRWCAGLDVRGQQARVDLAQAEVVRVMGHLLGRVELPLVSDRLTAAAQLAAGPAWVRAQRGTQTQERWQLDAEVSGELALRVAGPVCVFLRVGAGLTSGPTPVYVNDTQVSELPIAAGRATIGLRLGR